MKLNARTARGWLAGPDADAPGALLYGADPVRVAEARRAMVAARIGPDGARDMRLETFEAAALRKDPARLIDGLKATGFFAGPRAVVVTEATDSLTRVIEPALDQWSAGDALLVIEAGPLPARSSLRKLFEKHGSAAAIAFYDDPPDRDEIGGLLRAAGLAEVAPDGIEALLAMGRATDRATLGQTIEKLALYKASESAPARAEDVLAVAPQTTDADLDAALDAMADGDRARLGQVLNRLSAQGVTPVSLCIAALRHFRTLHAAASDPGGAAAGVGKLRPPVFGPRRDRIARQASRWGGARLERALSMLIDTDLALRSAGQTAPAQAYLERALIRVAILGAAR